MSEDYDAKYKLEPCDECVLFDREKDGYGSCRRFVATVLQIYEVVSMYGPPILKHYKCRSCGKEWVVHIPGDYRCTHWCPICGEKIDLISGSDME